MQRPWRKSIRLSSIGGALESFLASAGLDRGPWLAVGFAVGIALWFVLPGPQEWGIAILLCAVAALAAGLGFKSWWGALGLVPLATAIFRFCPAYVPFGLSTCSRCDNPKPPAGP